MKYLDTKYQARFLNRLADIAYRKGGLELMRTVLDKATYRIWLSLEAYYTGKGVRI